MIAQQIKSAIRDIPDFPKPGIIFKDITPILKDPQLCINIVNAFAEQLKGTRIDAIAGIESRGFLFGLTLATQLGVPFIKKPISLNTALQQLNCIPMHLSPVSIF
jgi:adenine phosphoribosyltransferase